MVCTAHSLNLSYQPMYTRLSVPTGASVSVSNTTEVWIFILKAVSGSRAQAYKNAKKIHLNQQFEY